MENLDWDDIQACLGGEKAAFERLVRRHQDEIARLMWRFSRDSAVCERLVQDTFVEAYLGLKSYKAKAPFLHWLKKIATRAGYRFWKEQDREKRFVPLSAFSPASLSARAEAGETSPTGGEELDFAAPDNEQELEPGKAAEILHNLLDRLDSAERLVLTLMYLEDCSIREIAQRMGWTSAGTKMRAMRARRKLKKIAEKEKILEKLEWMQ